MDPLLDKARAAQNTPCERWCPPCQLDVRPPHLHDVWLACPRGDPACRKPMRVQEICVGTPRRTDKAREQRRSEQRKPRTSTDVPDHPVPVREAVATELLRPDDLDVDPPAPHVLDRVGDEAADGVAGKARIRRREDGDAHQPLCTLKTA